MRRAVVILILLALAGCASPVPYRITRQEQEVGIISESGMRIPIIHAKRLFLYPPTIRKGGTER